MPSTEPVSSSSALNVQSVIDPVTETLAETGRKNIFPNAKKNHFEHGIKKNNSKIKNLPNPLSNIQHTNPDHSFTHTLTHLHTLNIHIKCNTELYTSADEGTVPLGLVTMLFLVLLVWGCAENTYC